MVWHDAGDKVVPVKQSRDLMKVLKRYNIQTRITNETKNVGHVPTGEMAERIYRALPPERELYPVQVTLQSNRPETLFNRIDWLQSINP